ncbi:MAG: hypothetical protein JW967_04580 [Dehalococcoidales bacterium]|nr:hypothetical protein [Dehalococcoidales bacterium]
MKFFLTVTDYSMQPNGKRMLYKNDKGDLFDGPINNVVIGSTYIVEVADKRPEDTYYYIGKFVGEVGKS